MKATQRSQALLQAPEALMVLRRGFEKLATPLASTLGPSQRFVINEITPSEIELLADTGTIATRFIELKVRGENVGAMMLRNMVMQLHQNYGDGAATATVLAREMLRDGTRLLAAGINPAILRQGIERGIAIARQELKKQALPVDRPEMFTGVATGVTGDPALGKLLGEMLDMLGEQPGLIVGENEAPTIDREYIAGGQWVAIPGERLLIPEGSAGLELHRPLIMVIDEDLKELDQVQKALELVVSLPEKPPLLIVTREASGAALEALILNHIRGILTVGIALLRSGVLLYHEDMGDVAALTGAQVLSQETGRAPRAMQLNFFGRARKATMTRNSLTIIDGAGEGQAVRKRTAEVRAQIKNIEDKNGGEWQRLHARLGRLAGGIGVIKIGAYSERERDAKKEQVQKALRALEELHEAGAVPGGGVAYLQCIPAVLAASRACTSSDEAAGIALVATALEAPFTQIVRNYGKIYPPLALEEVHRLGPGYGFDGLRGEYACMVERGILDSARVAQAALEAAGSLAVMAITTDSIVMV